jgi:hypothetical protein
MTSSVRLHFLNIDHLLLDEFSVQKHFQSSLALVLDALVVPRTTDAYCGLAATDLTECDAKPSVGLFCE